MFQELALGANIELVSKATDLFDDETTIAVPNKNDSTILLLQN